MIFNIFNILIYTDTWDFIFLLVKEVSHFFSPSPASSSARLFLLGESDGEPLFPRPDRLRLDSPKLNFDLDLPSLRPLVVAVLKLFFLPDFLPRTDLNVCVPCSL